MPLFDNLPKPTIRKLESCAAKIERLRAKGVELIFAMGRELKIAHDELSNHGDGCFGKWCKERCGISKSTAFDYLNAVDVFEGRLSAGRTNFDAKALYLLARDSTPQDAIDKAIEAAEKGERITLAKAKEIVSAVVIDVEPTAITETAVLDEDSFNLPEAISNLRELFAGEAEDWPASMREELVHFWKQVASERAGDESWLKGE